MRVTRSILLLLALAITAAGCGFQPAPWIPVTSNAEMGQRPVPVASAAAPSIDNTIYGSTAADALPASASPDAARGLFASAALPPARPPRYARPLPDQRAPAAYAAAVPSRPYTLDSGDRLRIVVFGQDGLSNSYLVDASGYIAMPLIGSVLARGATTDQLSARIADKLRQGFVKEPHVAVEVEAYRPFFILGEVTQPGQYPYVADMTVETAVAIAGGFGPRAYRQTVTVTRIMHGRQVQMTVPTSFSLRPGDTINVHERWF